MQARHGDAAARQGGFRVSDHATTSLHACPAANEPHLAEESVEVGDLVVGGKDLRHALGHRLGGTWVHAGGGDSQRQENSCGLHGAPTTCC